MVFFFFFFWHNYLKIYTWSSALQDSTDFRASQWDIMNISGRFYVWWISWMLCYEFWPWRSNRLVCPKFEPHSPNILFTSSSEKNGKKSLAPLAWRIIKLFEFACGNAFQYTQKIHVEKFRCRSWNSEPDSQTQRHSLT